jgi:hypothetical protein
MLTFAALVVAVLAIPGYFSYSNLLDTYKDQKDTLGNMEEKLRTQEKEIDDIRSRLGGPRNNYPVTATSAPTASQPRHGTP